MPYATIKDHVVHYFDSSVLHQAQNEQFTILMIHGLGSSQNYWMPVISQLSPKFRCIALDSYGAGRSKSKGEKLTLDGLAEDAVSLMDSLSIQKFVVAGHSMGGTMTCIIAAKHPDRVVGFVPVGPVNPGSVKPEMFSSRIETVLKGLFLVMSTSKSPLTNRADGMEPISNTVPTAATSTQASSVTRGFIRELIMQSDPKAYASHCQAIVDSREPDFAAIKAPALFIAGSEDNSAPLEGVKYIHEHVGSSKKDLRVFDGCGHWHCVETPDRVAKEMEAFCSSL
jgi:pimeloyl-ACP methyl ester carboxylesterase